MRYRQTLLVIVLGVLLITPTVARSDDVEDLKAVLDQLTTAFNQQDIDSFVAFVHDQAVWFTSTAPFPTEGKAAIRQGFQGAFSTHESLMVRPMNLQYRVIENSGSVIGHLMLAAKPQDGPLQTSFLRVLQNWVKVDGKWLLVSAHNSRLPSGD